MFWPGIRAGFPGDPTLLSLAHGATLKESLLTVLLFFLVSSSGCHPATPVGSAVEEPAQDPVRNVATQQPKGPAEGESSEPALTGKKKKHTNRLVDETSPYLLMHAHNPVDWYPWGEEAFEKAKKENKVVFLSIGYSSCHWCHVMEHESFENDEVADLMNDAFVCIKVDREERPDIDNVYMEVTQMMNQRGGWPMTVIMTPDKKPFFSGTYFPKNSRGRKIGMMQLIPLIKDAWENNRDSLKTDASNLTSRLKRRQINRTSDADISLDIMEKAFRSFQSRYDEKLGGFGSAPKFPKAHDYSFL